MQGSYPSSNGLNADAITHARRGWPVLPLYAIRDGHCTCPAGPECASPGKHPHVEGGVHAATTDEIEITAWWVQWPSANIAVATGAASGLVVLDVDPRHGGDNSLAALEAEHGPLPDTVEVKTGGGGRHIYFRHPGNGANIRSKTSFGGFDGLDIKADDGYVVAPSSIHASGQPYEWEASSHPDDIAIAEMPAWLLELVTGSQTKATTKVDVSPKICEGSRNTSLTRTAGRLRAIGLGLRTIESALSAENQERCIPPLPDSEVSGIAASICRYTPGEAVQHRPLSEPQFFDGTGEYVFNWAEEGVELRLSRFVDEGTRVSAELCAASIAEDSPTHIHRARLNLCSTQSRSSLSQHLMGNPPAFDWAQALEQVCLIALDCYRHSEPPRWISAGDTPIPTEYLLHPILPRGQTAIVFGEGGVGKSLTAVLLGLVPSAGWSPNPFYLIPQPGYTNVLYLDWEASEDSVLRNLKLLQEGLKLSQNIGIYYRRCLSPLGEDLPNIRNFIDENDVRLVIVDSLAAACGGDVNDAAVASKFMARDMASLGTTNLCIAHNSKNPAGTKTVFGSVFFTNYARSVWECKRDPDATDDCLDVGLFCRKVNLSKRFKPIGIRFCFYDDKVTAQPFEVKDAPGFERELPLYLRIANALKENPRMMAKALAVALGTSDGSVRATLNKYSKGRNCWFVNITKAEGHRSGKDGDEWGLSQIPAPKEIITVGSEE